MAEANAILNRHSPTGESDFLDLSEYSQADPQAIELFANREWTCVILGLTRLEIPNASAIAKLQTSPEFTNLTYMSQGTAALLSEPGFALSIDGVLEIDACMASELASYKADVRVKHLEHLSLEAAMALAKHKYEMFVSFDAPPPMGVQRSFLFAYEGDRVEIIFPSDVALSNDDLYFNWLRKIYVGSSVDDAGQIFVNVISTAKYSNQTEMYESLFG